SPFPLKPAQQPGRSSPRRMFPPGTIQSRKPQPGGDQKSRKRTCSFSCSSFPRHSGRGLAANQEGSSLLYDVENDRLRQGKSREGEERSLFRFYQLYQGWQAFATPEGVFLS